MLDAARITLADHRAYDLSGFYIVCTSNIGSQQLLRPTRLPFATLERAVVSELHRFFRPELIGRFERKSSSSRFPRIHNGKLAGLSFPRSLTASGNRASTFLSLMSRLNF